MARISSSVASAFRRFALWEMTPTLLGMYPRLLSLRSRVGDPPVLFPLYLTMGVPSTGQVSGMQYPAPSAETPILFLGTLLGGPYHPSLWICCGPFPVPLIYPVLIISCPSLRGGLSGFFMFGIVGGSIALYLCAVLRRFWISPSHSIDYWPNPSKSQVPVKMSQSETPCAIGIPSGVPLFLRTKSFQC